MWARTELMLLIETNRSRAEAMMPGAIPGLLVRLADAAGDPRAVNLWLILQTLPPRPVLTPRLLLELITHLHLHCSPGTRSLEAPKNPRLTRRVLLR